MITVQNLNFTYPGNKTQTLHDLNFKIPPGEIFGFLGPSGAGKSTTQKLLIGLLKGYSGTIEVNGTDMKHIKSNFYESIGVMFEFPNLYTKFSAIENLLFFKKLYKSATTDPYELLSKTGLEKDANTRVAEFSKGMKVRLNFCRALLNTPKLLFLDEPTSGLDPTNTRNMINLIRELADNGTTVILSTHNMHVADVLCHRVAFIVDGKLPLINSPRELKLEHGKRLLTVEFRQNNHLLKQNFQLDGLAENPEFHTLLQEKHVETMHTQEATLEDIFIKTTGRALQ